MFVKTSRRRRGDKTYEYLSLVETVRDGDRIGHRTLLRLGEVSELRRSGQLERIIAALESHLQRERVDVAAPAATGAPAPGAVAAVAAVWERLGLGTWFAKVGADRGAARLEHAVFAMVANRLADPCSKRRLPEWVQADVAMPGGFEARSTDQYYRALDAVADAKEATEMRLYATLCDLTNMDLRFVCHDLTSTYFEGSTRPSGRFPNKAFGYSRDHRGDRPQVVIGLLCTGDGTPIAHHVFAGNTADVSTLPSVLADLAERFGVSPCVVADRGLISEDNVQTVEAQGFNHVLATRLHRDAACTAALGRSAEPSAAWVAVPDANSAACDVTSTTAAEPWWSRRSSATTATRPAPPSWWPAPKPSCGRWNGGCATVTSSTPPRSAGPRSASSGPPVWPASSTSRSTRAGSSTTTTTTPALRELDRVRSVTLDTGGSTIGLVTRRTPLQQRIFGALGVDTTGWDRALIR